MRKTRILFLCTGNSARSQMAEGLMKFYRGDVYDVFSAGTEPAGVHPKAVEVMREIGIDISRQRSKHLDEFADKQFDYIITLCDRAKQSCPVVSGKGKVIHCSFSDPAAETGSDEQITSTFREVRDDLKDFICSLEL